MALPKTRGIKLEVVGEALGVLSAPTLEEQMRLETQHQSVVGGQPARVSASGKGRDGQFQQFGAKGESVRSLSLDPTGLLWVGTHSGLWHFAEGSVYQLAKRDGLPDDRVLSVHHAADGAVAAGFALQIVEPHLNGPGGDAPIIHYCQPVLDRAGETLWYKQQYTPWEPTGVTPSDAALGYCAELLTMFDRYAALRRRSDSL